MGGGGSRLWDLGRQACSPRMATCFQAVDLRLQSHRWMNDLEVAGGRVIVEKIDPDRLDAIAASHELELVAAGRGPLAEVFPRHAERKLLLISQYGSSGVSGSPKQRIADAVLENFIDPRRFTNAFVDKAAARKLIAELSGQSWRRAFWDGALRGAAGQFRRLLGTGPAYVNPLAQDL